MVLKQQECLQWYGMVEMVMAEEQPAVVPFYTTRIFRELDKWETVSFRDIGKIQKKLKKPIPFEALQQGGF